MRTLHFVLIARNLTGDSEVLFFTSKLEAEFYFKSKVKPLLDICERKELAEDEVYSFGKTKNIVRIDSGYDEELDAALGECNTYFFLGEIEADEDITHYVADFSEWVDESVIDFFTEEKAKEVWNDKIDEEIVLASQYQGVEISRYHQDTWEDESGMTLYQETHYSDMYSDAYFGYSIEMSSTFRVGVIQIRE